jgi:hypothetical protein
MRGLVNHQLDLKPRNVCKQRFFCILILFHKFEAFAFKSKPNGFFINKYVSLVFEFYQVFGMYSMFSILSINSMFLVFF